jgi:predicted nucleic acid-binding protein
VHLEGMKVRKLKIYLDTSVISYLHQLDAPDKMNDTLALWEEIKAGEYQAVISEVTTKELMNCAEPKRSIMVDYLSEADLEVFAINKETDDLAQEIIRHGILTPKSIDDSTHIASAIINNCDIIVSWNFKHLVNIKTINGVRAIILSNHYKSIDIYSPTMLLKGDD